MSTSLPAAVLGSTLKQLRLHKTWTQANASTRMRFSEAKLSAIENGRRVPSMFDLAGMCRVYEAPASVAKQLGNLLDYQATPYCRERYGRDHTTDTSIIRAFVESGCQRLYAYGAESINPLAQTETYARTVLAQHLTLTPHEREAEVARRMERQQRFWSRHPHPEVCLIMHDTAISLPLGDPDGEAEQQNRLHDLAEIDGVDIRIIPASHGAHPSMQGCYTIAAFPHDHDLSEVVYIDAIDGSRYETDTHTIDYFGAFFEATRQHSQSIKEEFHEYQHVRSLA